MLLICVVYLCCIFVLCICVVSLCSVFVLHICIFVETDWMSKVTVRNCSVSLAKGGCYNRFTSGCLSSSDIIRSYYSCLSVIPWAENKHTYTERDRCTCTHLHAHAQTHVHAHTHLLTHTHKQRHRDTYTRKHGHRHTHTNKHWLVLSIKAVVR